MRLPVQTPTCDERATGAPAVAVGDQHDERGVYEMTPSVGSQDPVVHAGPGGITVGA
jgi:hypothetical protein